MPLGRTVMSSCLLRRTGDGQAALRHFAPVLRLRNPEPARLALALEKPEQDGLVEAVLVRGRKVPFEVDGGLLKYAADLGVGEELNVTVLYRKTPRVSRSPTWKYRVAASARRVLCEIRDNHLARSEPLLAFSEKIRGMFSSGKRGRPYPKSL